MKPFIARRLGSIVAATLVVGAPLVPAGPADAAKPHRCPSERTVAKSLKKANRKHLVRSSYHPNGVFQVRCSGAWATGIAEIGDGGISNGAVVLLHRTHGRWHEVSRDKPCAQHKVPRKIYQRACLSG